LPGQHPEEDVLAKAYLLAFALALKYSGTMNIQLDLLETAYAVAQPHLVYADELAEGWEERSPADLLSLIVLEGDGTVVPISYDFSRRFQICNLQRQSLAASWPAFLRETYPAYRNLCRTLFQELTSGNRPLFNWYEQIVAYSRTAPLRSATPETEGLLARAS
jgi:hypothetical protein